LISGFSRCGKTWAATSSGTQLSTNQLWHCLIWWHKSIGMAMMELMARGVSISKEENAGNEDNKSPLSHQQTTGL
jgi:hypothetical protein